MIDMIVQKGKIKTEGERKRIPDVASVQPDGIATAVKPKEKAAFDLQFNFEQKGKRREWKHKKPGKRLKIEGGSVKRERSELPIITVAVDGVTFTRAHEEGKGRRQEALIRYGSNLENMVLEVKRVTFAALFDGTYAPEDDTMAASNRHLSLIAGLCTEKGALDASLFETTQGKQMLNNFAFSMMVRQFFRDVDFAGKVVGWAAREYSELKTEKPLSVIPTMVRMASASATVDGVPYTRTFPAGDREAEQIVRRNLELFVKGAMEAAKLAVAQERRASDAHLYCYPPEGVLDMRNFETVDGEPLKDEAMFRRAISQFFCDSEMAKKAIKQALG